MSNTITVVLSSQDRLTTPVAPAVDIVVNGQVFVHAGITADNLAGHSVKYTFDIAQPITSLAVLVTGCQYIDSQHYSNVEINQVQVNSIDLDLTQAAITRGGLVNNFIYSNNGAVTFTNTSTLTAATQHLMTTSELLTSVLLVGSTTSEGFTGSLISAAGEHDLARVARIDFRDASVDFTPLAHQVASDVAAIFPRDSLAPGTNLTAACLKMAQQGASREHLVDLLLSARLGANFTSEQEINLLYSNLLHRGATAGEVTYWQTQPLSPAALAEFAADSSFNQVQLAGQLVSTAGGVVV